MSISKEKNMTKSIEQLVIDLSQRLKAQEWKLVTAESCTGGGLAYHLTRLSGSSDWFERGFVTYSNTAKEEMLGVNPVILSTFGAVSEETAQEMAEGALRVSQGQVSVAITGIAGPTGGSVEKPVGTVWFGWAGVSFGTLCEKHVIPGNRDEVREKAVEIALTGLIKLM